MPDRRFGTWNKFGATNKFGASSSINSNLSWGIEIDWDGDYIFESNEARYMTGIRGFRGRPKYVTRNGQGFEKLGTGRYFITLDNSTGRYDAWNTSSPLFPNVIYGKDVRITVRSSETGTVYPVFYGTIEDISAINSSNGEQKALITVVDGWQYLRNITARYSIQTNVTPTTAMGYVLDAIEWPNHWGRSLDSLTDNIPYWWANGDKTAASELEDLAESFLGYLFVDATGKAHFKSRLDISTSVVSLTNAILLKDLSLPQPWEYSRNITRIKVHPRTQSTLTTIYQLVGIPPVVLNGAANALPIFANYTYNNQAVPAINVAVSVFEANTQADFLGTDKTAQCAAVLTDFGQTGLVTITNSSGGDVYIRLELEGNALYEPNVSDIVYYGTGYKKMPREFRLDLLWQQSLNVATDFSNVIGPYLAELHPFPIIQLEARPDEQFAPDLFDIVSLTLTGKGISGDTYRVAYIEHESLGQNCQAVRTKFCLESYISGEDFWAWDTASVFDTDIFGA